MLARILLVDDDLAVLRGLHRALSLEDYEVIQAADGETALEAAATRAPDLVVLDVMLPGVDGMTVCRALRDEAPSLPVLMLTARDTVPARVAGLDAGADDYLVKPFATEELLARIRALLRRTASQWEPLCFNQLSVDLSTRQAFIAGHRLNLTPHEFELLTLFLRHPQQALSREQLSGHVWGYDFDHQSNFVDVAIKELRKKLEATGNPRLIQTVRAYGYALREE
jgi:two-component system response regulator MprA